MNKNLTGKKIFALHKNEPCHAVILGVNENQEYIIKVKPENEPSYIIKTTEIQGFSNVSTVKK